MKLKKAFTLVELIVVIAILAILSVTAFVTFTKWFGKSRDSRRMADVNSIVTAINTKIAEKATQWQKYKLSITWSIVYSGDTTNNIYDAKFDDTALKAWDLSDVLQKTPKDPQGPYYAVGFYSGSAQTLFNVAATLENDQNWNSVLTTFIDGNFGSWSNGISKPSLIFEWSYGDGNWGITPNTGNYLTSWESTGNNVPYKY